MGVGTVMMCTRLRQPATADPHMDTVQQHSTQHITGNPKRRPGVQVMFSVSTVN